jgi:hypothetical protein
MSETKVTLEDFAKVVLGCLQEIYKRLEKLEGRIPVRADEPEG